MRVTHSPITTLTSSAERRSPREAERRCQRTGPSPASGSSPSTGGGGGVPCSRAGGGGGEGGGGGGGGRFRLGHGRDRLGEDRWSSRKHRREPLGIRLPSTSIGGRAAMVTSPGCRRHGPRASRCSTVPFSQPNPRSRASASLARTTACRREMSGSSIVMSAFVRPRTISPATSNRSPRAGDHPSYAGRTCARQKSILACSHLVPVTFLITPSRPPPEPCPGTFRSSWW